MADLLTPTVDIPYANPDDPLGGAAASMGALALSLEGLLLAASRFSDATWPQQAAAVTAETTIDRITVPSRSHPQRVIVLGMAYVTYTQAAEVDLLWYADAVVAGRSRRLHVAAAATDRFCLGIADIDAGDGAVMDLRIARQTGTGSMTTSISGGLTRSVALALPKT